MHTIIETPFCRHERGFVLYGGKLGEGELSDELWLYDTELKSWSLRAPVFTRRPPPLTRHSLTAAHQGWMYLFGGSTSAGEFSSAMWRAKLGDSPNLDVWEEVG